MKRVIVASILALFFLVAFVPISNAEMAKEGTDSGTNVYTATSTMVSLDKDRSAIAFELLGVYLSDTGGGPFHNMSTHSVGVIYFDKGVGETLGYMVMTAPDGDKVLLDLKEDKTLPPPNPNKGTGKYLGGTGKFAGIEGTLEYSRYYTRPSKKGVGQAVSRVKSHWKIPEAKK